MTAQGATTVRRATRPAIPRARVPVLVTAGLLVAMFVAGGLRYEGFASGQVVLNVFIDNAFLLVIAVGMTFVILSGGIDLSVGAVAALATMIAATLLRDGWAAPVVIALVLAVGTVLGLTMGAIIHYFEIQPFIVTLAGMFLARGLCFTIGTDSIPIDNPGFTALAYGRIDLGPDLWLSPSVLIAAAVVLAGGEARRFGGDKLAAPTPTGPSSTRCCRPSPASGSSSASGRSAGRLGRWPGPGRSRRAAVR